MILGHTKAPQPIPRDWLSKRKAISKALRQRVFDKCGGRCGYCGHELIGKWCVDHMHAHYRGGDDSFENLMPACTQCNLRKMASSIDGFRREIEDQVNRARKYSSNFRFAERFGLIAQVETKVTFYFERLAASAAEGES